MKKNILLIAASAISIIFMSSTSMAKQAQCAKGAEKLGAQYLIKNIVGKKTLTEKKFNLWRNGADMVAHEYESDHMTLVWNQVKNGYVRPIRYFDAHQRAIEYQPHDLNKGKGEKEWSSKYQLIPDAYKATLEKVKDVGEGCEKVEHYAGKNIQLEWYPELKLVKRYVIQKNKSVEEWTLVATEKDMEKVNNEFVSREKYLSTDYADIGDNESDPFLMQMINLGFVEHGASGFYDSEGNQLESRHEHGHHGHAH